ncbi:hypothetical protein [Rhodovibrio sodomensis]|nr:hypothetical protein [Rhodovibrio sodomensis]
MSAKDPIIDPEALAAREAEIERATARIADGDYEIVPDSELDDA